MTSPTQNPLWNHVAPADIEKTSFSIIAQELSEQGKSLPSELAPIIMRVIHTTADFDYADTLRFSPGVTEIIKNALKNGTPIVTDTNMALSGINKTALASCGSAAYCFMADDDVAREAKEKNCTRAAASMRKAMRLEKNAIFAIGNAPTALVELNECIENGYTPVAIIGVPVGFVNVVPAKELIMARSIPYIVNEGRKGGSTVAAAICNALLYSLSGER